MEMKIELKDFDDIELSNKDISIRTTIHDNKTLYEVELKIKANYEISFGDHKVYIVWFIMCCDYLDLDDYTESSFIYKLMHIEGYTCKQSSIYEEGSVYAGHKNRHIYIFNQTISSFLKQASTALSEIQKTAKVYKETDDLSLITKALKANLKYSSLPVATYQEYRKALIEEYIKPLVDEFTWMMITGE